ncbi:MAG: T9SS type A sorting domain-containing protein [Ignavibacteriaceae bacterium]|nr:T9SS type A sorting domain-containing protein [Ignavibacteriaceae bacterium]
MSSGIPAPIGTISPILVGQSAGLDIQPTYISTIDTLQVILDLYNLIEDEGFLRRVLEYFNLIPQQNNVEIQFYPAIDTAWIFGGCTGPDLITHHLVSTPVKDSITIEPGPNSYFFYYDSLGNIVQVDKYYFIVTDLFDQYEYELWFYPKSWPPFDPVIISFDSIFYFQQNTFEIQLLVKHNGNPIDSLSQLFRADWGLSVEVGSKDPETFSLSQNYPNPFNPSTSLQYAIGSRQFVTLKVYDLLGREVATLVNEEKHPGTYEVEFNATGLPSGVYFYQLIAGNYIETKKMVLIK